MKKRITPFHKLILLGATALGSLSLQAQTAVLYPNSSTDALMRANMFGNSVSTNGSYLAVGDDEAYSEDGSLPASHLVAGSGEVTLFYKQNGTWSFKQRFRPRRNQGAIDYCNPSAFQYDKSQNREVKFGNTVVLKNDLLLISAPRARKKTTTQQVINGSSDGVVYVYKRNAVSGNYDAFTNTTEIGDSQDGTFFGNGGVKSNGTYITVHTNEFSSGRYINGVQIPFTSLYRYDGNTIYKVREFVGARVAAITQNNIVALNYGDSLVFLKYNTATNQATNVFVPEFYSKLDYGAKFDMVESDGSTIVASYIDHQGLKGGMVIVFNNDSYVDGDVISFPAEADIAYSNNGIDNTSGHIAIKEGKAIFVAKQGGVIQYNWNPTTQEYDNSTSFTSGSPTTTKNIALSSTEVFVGNRGDAVLAKRSPTIETCTPPANQVLNHGKVNVYNFVNSSATNYEPNETSQTATAFPIYSTVHGGISFNGDKDYYKLVLNTSGTIKLWLSNLENDYNLELYNATNTRLAFSQNTGATDESISYSAAAGTYYVHVYGQNGVNSTTSVYKLNNVITNACSASNEPNDLKANATSFNLNSSIQGNMAYQGDIDVYKIVVSTRGNVSFTLSNYPIELTWNLYDDKGTTVRYSPFTSGSFYISPGTYYLHIFAPLSENSINCYTLSNTFFAANCTDSNEPNNVREQAKGMFYDDIFGNITTVGDVDWYSYTDFFPTGQWHLLQVTLTELTTDFDVVLYDKNGGFLGSSLQLSNNPEKIDFYINTDRVESYYIKVYPVGSNTSSQCYKLSVRTTPGSPFARIEAEPEMGQKEEAVSSYLLMQPNPGVSGGSVQLSASGMSDVVNVRILSLSGELVSEQAVNMSGSKGTLDLASVVPGMYIVDAGAAGKTKLVVE